MSHKDDARHDRYCYNKYTTGDGQYTLARYRPPGRGVWTMIMFDNLPNPSPWCVVWACTWTRFLVMFEAQFKHYPYRLRELVPIIQKLAKP